MWTKNVNIFRNASAHSAVAKEISLSHSSSYKQKTSYVWDTFNAYNLKIQTRFIQMDRFNNVLPKNKHIRVKSGLSKFYTEVVKNDNTLCNHLKLSSLRNISRAGRIFYETMKLNNPRAHREKIFENPKEIIYNFFDEVATKLGYEELRLKQVLEKVDNGLGLTFWSCKFKVKWPEEKVFSAVSLRKADASRNGALSALRFLGEKNVISSIGKPLLNNNLLSIGNIRSYTTHSSKEIQKEQLTHPRPNVNEVPQNKVKINEGKVLKVSQLFPHPKGTLGNIFQLVSNDKGTQEKWLSISYKQVEKSWVCTYKIKWPEEKSFSVSALSKQQASSKCALEILEHLLKSNKIDDKGVPIIYDKNDVKELVRKDIPTLCLTEKHTEKLKKIIDFHTTQIFPILVDPKEKIQKLEEDEEFSDDNVKTYTKKFLGHGRYKCNEKLHLPISDYKEEIIRLVQENRVLIVKGEPGCGKSTRVPQYILEGWAREAAETREPCNIVVTEPRRIAAVSLADRVASERNEEVGNIVGYQVRFKSNFQHKTGRILYCTNGILLQQFKSDPNLSKYTHIVIDEAHERDINTDLLLNLLKKILDENSSLKVVIMSATIDTNLFQNYFKDSALIHIPGFTFPVKSHFIDNCKLDLQKTIKMCKESKPSVVHEDVVKVLMHLHEKKPEGAILCFLPGWEDIRKIRDLMPYTSDINVMCLHSRLQDSEQWKIFSKSPAGVRKIILSTNIAETSVTIDDVVYVVDTGIHKETMLDVEKGVMCIDNHWISKSSVDQRKGRAGRVKAGESFHLYPRETMQAFSTFSLPEVLRVSLTKVVLDSKMFSQDMNALEFFSRLPSPPSRESVELAVAELKDLELIDDKENLTRLGEVVAGFQLEPKLSKTLVNSVIYKCVTPIVDIVTLFSSGMEIFTSSLDQKGKIRSLKSSFSKTSDHLSIMRIYEIWDDFRNNGNRNKMEKFCNDLHLQPARLNVLNALRSIHFDYLRDGLKCRVLPISDDFSDDDEVVKAVLLSGVGTFLSYKNWSIVKGRLKKENVFLTRLNHKATVTPDSVNFKNTSLKSNFLLYINETRSNVRRTTLIRETSLISPITVLLFSNKKILLHNIDKNQYSPNLESDDQVILSFAGTNLKFLLDRQHAVSIMQCKLALSTCYDYYLYQLTYGGEHNRELNSLWDELLTMLSDFLGDFKFK